MGARRAIPRSLLPPHKLAALRARDALRKRTRRQAMDAAERAHERAKDKARKAAKRHAERQQLRVRLPPVAELLAAAHPTNTDTNVQLGVENSVRQAIECLPPIVMSPSL